VIIDVKDGPLEYSGGIEYISSWIVSYKRQYSSPEGKEEFKEVDFSMGLLLEVDKILDRPGKFTQAEKIKALRKSISDLSLENSVVVFKTFEFLKML